jgi:PPP family 3-phenylpropionic acid transporter
MTRRYRILYFIRFLGDSFFFPYFSLYIASLGYEGTTLGIILSITPFVNIIANTIWSIFTSDVQKTRKIIQWITVIEALVVFLFTKLETIQMVVLLTVLLGAIDGPYYNMQDGITATYANNNNVEYSTIRVCASISYAIGSFLAGIVIQYYGYGTSFTVCALLFFISVFLIHRIAPIKDASIDKKKSGGNLKELLTNPSYLNYLVFILLCLNASSLADAYFVIYLQSIGLAESNVGLVLGITVVFEALTMILLYRYGSKVSERQWIIIALILIIIRFGTYALDLPLIPVLVVSSFKGISWGIILFANIKYIIKIVGIKQVTAAILVNSIANSIISVIAHPILGYIYKNIGFPQLFLIIIVIMIIGIIYNAIFPPKMYPVEKIEDN